MESEIRDTSSGQSNEDERSNLGHVAFETLDLAAAMFSSDLSLETTNAAWRNRFGNDRRAYSPGETLRDFFEFLLSEDVSRPA